MLRHLVDLQYQRNDADLARARFRVRGDTLEFRPASEERIVRVEFFGDEVERITEIDPLTGELLAERKEINVYPATHYVTPNDKLKAAIVDIEAEMEERVGAAGGARAASSRARGSASARRSTSRCSASSGSARASRTTRATSRGARRARRPWTLLDYFPPDWLLVVDESHMTIPQVVGMYKNDRTRKEILVDFGFRLPSALDNRPLTFEEFETTVGQAIYMSATPGPYELEKAQRIAEQLVRPTGIVDPPISVRPTEGQIDDLMEEIKVRVDRGERAIVTTLTKRMAEDLTDYLRELGVKVQYLHSEVDTLERVAILRDLRLGVFDVVVGINLLREGIDLPEVTLVAILDADKEGFLRSAWSLIQMIGRAARNIGGEVVMYADRITEFDAGRDRRDGPAARDPGRRTTSSTASSRRTIIKGIRDLNDQLRSVAEGTVMYTSEREARDARLPELDTKKVEELVARMEAEMRSAAKELEFERAAALRDEIQQIRLRVLDEDQSAIIARAAELAAQRTPMRSGRGARARARQPVGVGAARGRAVARLAEPELRRTWIPMRRRRVRGRPVTVLPAGVDPRESARPRAPRRTGCPASATSTRTRAVGRPAGSIARPGTAPSPRTSAAARAHDRRAAADRGSAAWSQAELGGAGGAGGAGVVSGGVDAGGGSGAGGGSTTGAASTGARCGRPRRRLWRPSMRSGSVARSAIHAPASPTTVSASRIATSRPQTAGSCFHVGCS